MFVKARIQQFFFLAVLFCGFVQAAVPMVMELRNNTPYLFVLINEDGTDRPERLMPQKSLNINLDQLAYLKPYDIDGDCALARLCDAFCANFCYYKPLPSFDAENLRKQYAFGLRAGVIGWAKTRPACMGWPELSVNRARQAAFAEAEVMRSAAAKEA